MTQVHLFVDILSTLPTCICLLALLTLFHLLPRCLLTLLLSRCFFPLIVQVRQNVPRVSYISLLDIWMLVCSKIIISFKNLYVLNIHRWIIYFWMLVYCKIISFKNLYVQNIHLWVIYFWVIYLCHVLSVRCVSYYLSYLSGVYDLCLLLHPRVHCRHVSY